MIASSARYGRPLESLGSALLAVDLLEANAERARKAIVARLSEEGMAGEAAEDLARTWVSTGDFLLQNDVPGRVDFVVGNPPYVRLESVTPATMARYRQQCPTMRGRADLYVGFIEQGLRLLKPGAALGYICADRWMRNQYGADLRELISRSYAVETVISMHDAKAFVDEVSAYPAVVVLRNTRQERPTVVGAGGGFGAEDAAKVTTWMRQSTRRSMTTWATRSSPDSSPQRLTCGLPKNSAEPDSMRTRSGLGGNSQESCLETSATSWRVEPFRAR